jgi:PAS domain S-box-containing protein
VRQARQDELKFKGYPVIKPPSKIKAGPSTDAVFGQAILASPVAILITTSARHIIGANTAAADLLGYGNTQLTGLTIRQLYAIEEDWSTSQEHLEAAGSGSMEGPLSVTLRRATGEMFDALVTLLPSFDHSGHLSGVVEIIAPTSAQSTTVRPPSAENDTGHSVRLARGAAHDFKNLLAIILGNIELAQTAAKPKDMQMFLREASQASHMAARLADRMVGFARNRSGIPISIDVAAAIAQQLALLQHAAGSAISIVSDVPPASGIFFADRSALENAVLNLALNARDAMPNGGTLTISVRASESEHAAVTLPPRVEGYLEISVSDTGTGMTERVRRHAFDPFFSTKPPGRGTGLGLATVLGFAHQSGGTARIESTRGAGTTVTIILPKAGPV